METEEGRYGHTLYGCVDRNVCALAAAAILQRRTLYGCVDRNVHAQHKDHISPPLYGVRGSKCRMVISSKFLYRTPYGYVDRNMVMHSAPIINDVALNISARMEIGYL